MLQRARAVQASPAFAEVRRRRQAVEHRIARRIQLGLRQARVVGHPKVLFQVAMAAAVATLTRLAHAAATGPAPTDDPAAGALLGIVAALLATLTALGFARNAPPPSACAFRAVMPTTGRSRRATLLPVLAYRLSRETAGSRPDF